MTKHFLLSLIILSITFVSQSQWQPDLRLTNNPAFSFTSEGLRIATSGNIVHVVWYDYRDGNYEIYYKRSTNKGISWGTDTRLTNNSGTSLLPSLSVFGSTVQIAWEDGRDGNKEIYYKRSTDSGENWNVDMRLTNSPGSSELPSISVFGQFIHVIWQDNRDGNYEIYYKCSTDGGINWGTDIRLTNNPASSYESSVSISGSMVHAIWADSRDGPTEIFYKRSLDAGVNWGADTQLTNTQVWSRRPTVSVLGQIVHVAFDRQGAGFGETEMYYKRSTDGGVNWGSDIRLTTSSGLSWFPSISLSGSIVHLVWQDERDGNVDVYYKKSVNSGVSWDSDTRLTNHPERSKFPSISTSDSALHIVWEDYRDGNAEIYYKRNPTGNIVSTTNISSEIPKEFSLSQNYPNPFNPNTNIKFQVPKSGFVNMVVYDILGREIAVLVNEDLNPGTYEVEWNATNYPSGVYYYKLAATNYTETRKMVLIE